MLTNFKTISASIKRLREVEERVAQQDIGLTKREVLELTRDHDKLERALGGIKDMGGLPDIMVVIDTNKEAIAVAEANKLRIPVVAILDSNSSPDGIAYPIPGNDDAMRAIHLYCDLFAGAVLDGLQAELAASGIDIGARAQLAQEAAVVNGADQDEPVDGEPVPTMDEALGSEALGSEAFATEAPEGEAAQGEAAETGASS
jgi:small subunit ribosomal protein S2